MDIIEYIRRQIAAARRTSDGAMRDTTEEQLNWLPPGTANSIKATLLHTLTSEDDFIQVFIQDKPSLWDSGSWSMKIGLARPPGRDGGWEKIKAATVPLTPVLAYGQAVRQATDAYVTTLSAGDLDREVKIANQTLPVAALLVMLANHASSHAGEIAAIKGIQGVKGLPY